MPAYSKLLVASAKGGVGKSTTALGLAAAFAAMGKRVLLVDLDFHSRSLDMLTGASDLTVRDIGDLLFSENLARCSVDDPCTHPFEELPELAFIAACTAARMEESFRTHLLPAGARIRTALEQIIEWGKFDLLICDSGGDSEVPIASADLFDFTVITAEQSMTSVRAAEYAAARLEKAGASAMRLVICGFDLSSVKREKRAGIIEMIDRSALPCLGVVPFDRTLQKAQDNGVLPGKRALSTIAYANIAGRIAGVETPLFSGMGSLYRRRALAF